MHEHLKYFWNVATQIVNVMFADKYTKEKNRKIMMLQYVRFAKIFMKDVEFRSQAENLYEAYKLELGYDE